MADLAEITASDRRVNSRPAPEPLTDHIPELDLAHLRKLAEFRYQVRRFLHISHVAAEGAGMRFQQYQMLQCVCGMPEGVEPTIANVAARMFLKHNSTVELVDRTIAQGLLRRTGDPHDHRRILLRVTPEGERILASLGEFHTLQLEESGPELVEALNDVLEGRGESGSGYGASNGAAAVRSNGVHAKNGVV
jgi:DNA-binding MarR family transcriptional regulator